VVLYVLAGTHKGTVSTHTCSVQRFTPWILRVPHADCEYPFTSGSRAASSRRGASYALGARGTRGTVSTCTRSLSTAIVCRLPSLPRTSSARGTVGLPPRGNASEAGAGPMLHHIPLSTPARHGGTARYSEYPHAPAAYPERRRRPGRCRKSPPASAAQRSACARPVGGVCAPDCPEYPDGPLRRTGTLLVLLFGFH
jgi:hypothetical protein